MNRRSFLASVAALAVAPRLLAAEPVRLRVLSYNIHHGEGMDRRLDLDRIAGVIRDAKADLVALQEVDRSTTRTGNVDQAARLAELTKLNGVFGEAMPFAGGGYGNAILSRWPIGKTSTVKLPSGAAEEPRCLLVATVELGTAAAGARSIRFGATHLNHRNAAERLQQAKAIRAALDHPDHQPHPPTLVAGDLNAAPQSEEIKFLTAAYLDATAKPVPQEGANPAEPPKWLTSPADRPRSKIDYILAAPPAAWKVVEAAVIPETVASDHRPVLAVVELAG